MSFTITDSKQYINEKDAVFQAALGAVEGLEGKVVAQDATSGTITAKFNKRILGKTLGDRTHLNVVLQEAGDGNVTVDIEIYPLDAVGQKLMFGARKGVSRTVANWFIAHLEHRLPKTA